MEENENISNELKKFIHDLASDVTVIEGFVKFGLGGIRKGDDSEKNEEFLERGLGKIKELGNRIREFRDLTR